MTLKLLGSPNLSPSLCPSLEVDCSLLVAVMTRRGGIKRGDEKVSVPLLSKNPNANAEQWRARNGRPTEHPIRANYDDVKKTNSNYEAYYNELGIFRDDEKDEFWAALRRELPNSFRFTGSKA